MEEQKPQTPAPPSTKPSTRDLFTELLKSIKEWFMKLIDLEEGMDREGTIIAIKTGKRMQGANAWLLMCSIMIASLGLNLNSPAVIIGAMLISPLMSPILGIGLAVGINDREALFLSFRHFAIAILIALVTSTLYFVITPLWERTPEIMSRTQPTVLDGLVAVFGGLAGIISTSRKDKTNAIPGVAIATALMPPLCVTGFGIVEGFRYGDWTIMINSFYLFFLNSFFIALTTYLIIRLLNFPFKAHVNDREARRTRWIIMAFSLILILPSGRIFYQVVLQQKAKKNAEHFVEDYFGANSTTRCIDYRYISGDTTNQLILELLGHKISDDSLDFYYRALEKYQLKNTTLTLIQDADIGLEQINNMQLKLSTLGQMADKFQTISQVKSEQEREIEYLRNQIDSLARDTIPFHSINQEARILFQKINSIGFGKAQKGLPDGSAISMPVFMIDWERSKNRSERISDEKKLYDFLKLRAGLDTLQIISY